MNKQKSDSLSALFQFLALAYGIGWLFWIPAALSGQEVRSFPAILLHTFGGISPSVAGVIMVYRTKDSQGRRDFWRRTIDFRRIGLGWTLCILVLFPILALASIGLSTWLGAEPHAFSTLKALAANPTLLLATIAVGLVTGPLAEELGWRGFAQDILHHRLGWLLSSLVLGLLWWAWHLPLFFITGTSQYQMGVGTLPFWLFLLNIFPLTALIAWFYHQTNRSILSAILLHFSFNVTANLLFPLSTQASILYPLLMAGTAAAFYVFQPIHPPSVLPGDQPVA